MTKSKKPAEKQDFKPLLPAEEMPEQVTITLTRHTAKYMALRQHIGSGDINGNKLEVSYNMAGGGLIITIGGHTFEADLEKVVPELFDQIVLKQ